VRLRGSAALPGAAAPTRPLVVFCAATAWDGNRFPDQHMAERLASFARVLYVDPPLSVVRAPRRHGVPMMRSSLQQIDDTLFRLTPISLPRPLRPGIRALTYAHLRRLVARAVADLGGPVRALVVASLSPMFTACEAELRVLYGTDDFVAGGEILGLPDGWLRQREVQQLAEADLAVAVSQNLADKWSAMGTDTVLLPNGCDDQQFKHADLAPWPDDVSLPPPIAGFVGHISDRIDMRLLDAVADQGHSLLLVGPRQDSFDWARIERLLQLPNVQWVGNKTFEELPSYLRVMKVGLVPYADNEFNRSSFPLKTLEYLAAGRATVATDLPAIRWLGTDVITIASGHEEYAKAVTAALDAPEDPIEADRRRLVAVDHSWDRRAEDFARLLGLDRHTPVGGESPATPVTVAVVTYNSSDDLASFFAGLESALIDVDQYEIVVADNASSDDTLETVRAFMPDARLTALSTNVGYAAGINAALRTAQLRGAVLVLNPDTVPQPGCVRRLLDALQTPGTGIAVPRLDDGQGRLKFSLRREPTVLRALGEALLGGHRAARWPTLGEEIRSPSEYAHGRVADWASGAAMMISRRCVDEVGEWDESFFLYSEETDFTLRARDLGHRLRYVPEARVRHRGGDMERLPSLWSLVAVNRVRLYARRHGTARTGLFWCTTVMNEGLRAIAGRPTNRAALIALLRMPFGGTRRA